MSDNHRPTSPADSSQPDSAPGGLSPQRRKSYWQRNVRLVLSLLLIWAVVSFGCGILLHDWLDQWQLLDSGFPLGFWFAQQGSMLVFVVLVFYYARKMNKIDRDFGVDEE